MDVFYSNVTPRRFLLVLLSAGLIAVLISACYDQGNDELDSHSPTGSPATPQPAGPSAAIFVTGEKGGLRIAARTAPQSGPAVEQSMQPDLRGTVAANARLPVLYTGGARLNRIPLDSGFSPMESSEDHQPVDGRVTGLAAGAHPARLWALIEDSNGKTSLLAYARNMKKRWPARPRHKPFALIAAGAPQPANAVTRSASGNSAQSSQVVVWTLTHDRLSGYNSQGEEIRHWLVEEAHSLAQPAAHRLWIGAGNVVIVYTDRGSKKNAKALNGQINALYADGSGGAWVLAGRHRLVHLGPNLGVRSDRNLAADGITAGLLAGAPDPRTDGLFFVAGRRLYWLDPTAGLNLIKKLPSVLGKVTGLGVVVDTFKPTLRIVGPADNADINNPAPELVLAYNDDGAGVQTASLKLTLSGRTIQPDCKARPDKQRIHCALRGGYSGVGPA